MENQTKKDIVPDKNLIAFCGLYCGACRSYLNGKCPGCRENVKATWCKVRECCMENDLPSCAGCTTIGLKECKKFNNFFSRFFGMIFNSDRAACILRIRELGYDGYASEMASLKQQTIRKR